MTRLFWTPEESTRRYTRWTPERNNTLRRLWLDGLGAKEIAGQVNSTRGMVCRQAKNLGLPRRMVRKGKIIDMTGKKLGRYSVIALHAERSPGGQAMWLCRCDCGSERIVHGNKLRSGRSKSCRCIRKQMFAMVAKPNNNTKHGLYRSRVYKCWEGMKQRCFNPNAESYPYYGGRGIGICKRWLRFENFFADMGHPPPGMSLDRVNNDLGYFPGNCRWAPPSVQNFNRRPWSNWLLRYVAATRRVQRGSWRASTT